MAKKEGKTLGVAIDEIIGALEELESNARTTAVTAACAHLGIQLDKTIPSGPVQSNVPLANSPPPPPTSLKVKDIRTLKAEKNPRGTVEMACVVAYYLQELAPKVERKAAVTTADIKKYFKQAQFKLPKVITQVLVDAKISGYFDTPQRGLYELNAVGYNLVVHTLPRER